MKHLLTSYSVAPLSSEELSSEDFQELAATPLDPLQTWLLRHALCGGGQPDTMTLGPPARRHGGSLFVRGRCSWCGAASEADLDVTSTAPANVWWLSLAARLVVDYRAVLIQPDGVPSPDIGRCARAFKTAIQLSLLLEEAEQSGVTH